MIGFDTKVWLQSSELVECKLIGGPKDGEIVEVHSSKQKLYAKVEGSCDRIVYDRCGKHSFRYLGAWRVVPQV